MPLFGDQGVTICGLDVVGGGGSTGDVFDCVVDVSSSAAVVVSGDSCVVGTTICPDEVDTAVVPCAVGSVGASCVTFVCVRVSAGAVVCASVAETSVTDESVCVTDSSGFAGLCASLRPSTTPSTIRMSAAAAATIRMLLRLFFFGAATGDSGTLGEATGESGAAFSSFGRTSVLLTA